MASESGRENTSLNEVLFKEPYCFEFFQAVRLLERLYPDRAAVGRSGLPLREVVRFRSRVALKFPPSEVYELRDQREPNPEKQPPPEMTVNFMGLTGPQGVLPTHYTELVMERVRYKDTSLWSFFDIFTHRAISFFYRAWEKYRFPIAYERGTHDQFTEYLFDFVGMGTRGLRPRKLHFEDQVLIFYGGHVAQRPHSTVALEAMTSDHFGVPVKIKQFAGQWLKLDPESITFVGRQNSQLGVNTVIGTRVWDDQSKFRVRIGPLSFNEFRAFLPNGSAYKAAKSMIRFMVGIEFDYDMQLVLKAKEVPSTILTTRARRKPMLGWSSWLKTKPFTEDDDQVVLPIDN
jgi:type VI secretion system protein ImpH